MPPSSASRGGSPGPASGRRRARIFALQILYQSDAGREPLEESIEAFWENQGLPAPEVRAFAEELARGVAAHRAEIEERVRAASDSWEPERMARVDRAILSLAIHELLHREDIPPKVTINEYIEIAKRFSTEDSGAFVNGILDRISRDIGALPGRGGPPRPER